LIRKGGASLKRSGGEYVTFKNSSGGRCIYQKECGFLPTHFSQKQRESGGVLQKKKEKDPEGKGVRLQ